MGLKCSLLLPLGCVSPTPLPNQNQGFWRCWFNILIISGQTPNYSPLTYLHIHWLPKEWHSRLTEHVEWIWTYKLLWDASHCHQNLLSITSPTRGVLRCYQRFKGHLYLSSMFINTLVISLKCQALYAFSP